MKLGNCKLNSEIIKKILQDKKITSIEIDILLYLSLIQDEFGKIEGVKYSDVCKDISISTQGYYNCIVGLEGKGYIQVTENDRIGWNIIINDNIFSSDEDYKKGYLTTNRQMLHNPMFYKLKANEKKLLLQILTNKKDCVKDEDGNIKSEDFRLYVTTIKNWLGINNKYLIESYMKSLTAFFKILRFKKGSKRNEIIGYVIKAEDFPSIGSRAKVQEKDLSCKREKDFFLAHKFITMCRKEGIKCISELKEKINDLITLSTQYIGEQKVRPEEFFYVVARTLEEKKSIEPRLINKIIYEKLKKNASLEKMINIFLGKEQRIYEEESNQERIETYKNNRGLINNLNFNFF